MEINFRSVTEYPERHDANGILMRLIDGLGYRFYWATEGLSEKDYVFSPGEGCATIGELIGHIWGLMNWIHINFIQSEAKAERPSEYAAQREQSLKIMGAIRAYVAGLNAEQLFALRIEGRPFWHAINGPFSDALTHVGQIACFRRLSGNPVPKHKVFLCHE